MLCLSTWDLIGRHADHFSNRWCSFGPVFRVFIPLLPFLCSSSPEFMLSSGLTDLNYSSLDFLSRACFLTFLTMDQWSFSKTPTLLFYNHVLSLPAFSANLCNWQWLCLCSGSVFAAWASKTPLEYFHIESHGTHLQFTNSYVSIRS